jgi:hypothetical protein
MSVDSPTEILVFLSAMSRGVGEFGHVTKHASI